MRVLDVLDVSLLLELVRILAQVFGVGIIFLGRPVTVLDRVHPTLEPIFITLRWLCHLLLIHLIGVVAARFLLKLAIHVLPAVPVHLAATGQTTPTIYAHDMSRHFNCMFRSQKDDGFCHLGRETKAGHRHVTDRPQFERINLCLGQPRGAIEVCVDEAWCNAVHADTERSELHRRRPRKSLNTSLGHIEGEETWLRSRGLVRADVHDAAHGVAKELHEEL